VDRLSPEAPVPVIKLIEEYTLPGMASNVYLNLRNLGLSVDFIHNEEKVTKTRFIDKRSGQHLLRVDNEPKVCNWSGKTPGAIKEYDAVIISDYNKGFLTYENIENIIKQSSGPVFIDTKKIQLADISSRNVFIKINELEYKTARSLPSNLIVTLGDKGAMFKNNLEEIIVPTKSVDVVDVCGCGDTFLAALAYQFLITKDITKSIEFANIAAGLTVQKQGNYAPTLEEIENGY
jgi:D-beta-D-heptose 7-phosphate kinase/D-beta-D-heptose 1-phosphate adenosyltransferase